MAITRCPYCHAIIDEADKYCNNCGTQLLFPEDDTVEEEIPGEKIIDAETEEKDYEIYEPGADEGDVYTAEAAAVPRDETEKDDGAPDVVDEDEDTEAEDEEKDRIGTEELIEDIQEDLKEEEEEPETEWSAEAEDALEEALTGDEEDLEEEELEEVVLVDEIASVDAGEDQEEVIEEPAPPSAAEAVAAETLPGADEEKRDEEETWTRPIKPILLEEEEEEAPDEVETPGEVPVDEIPAETAIETDDRKPERESEAGAPEETEAVPGEETEAAAPAEEPPEEQTFDTWELDRMGRTVELGKEKVDKFIEIMAEKEEEEKTSREEEPLPAERPDTGGTLPPWADAMKGAPSFDTSDTSDISRFEETGEEAEAGEAPSGELMEAAAPDATEDEGILPRRRPSDSGIGYPERLTQAALPFAPDTAEEIETAEEEWEEIEEAEEEETKDRVIPAGSPRGREEFLRSREAEAGEEAGRAAEDRRQSPQRPFNLSAFLKAKAFDCVFLALLWVVTSWFAARSLETTLFRLLSSAGGGLLALYLTFIVMYFFLFQFFLGETLGDRLFRKRD